jgi:hypothetical protein
MRCVPSSWSPRIVGGGHGHRCPHGIDRHPQFNGRTSGGVNSRAELRLPVLVGHTVIPETEDKRPGRPASQPAFPTETRHFRRLLATETRRQAIILSQYRPGACPTRTPASWHRTAPRSPAKAQAFPPRFRCIYPRTGHVSFPGKRRRALLDREKKADAAPLFLRLYGRRCALPPKNEKPETNGAVRRRSAERRAHGARIPARARSNRPAPKRWTWSRVGGDASRSETGRRGAGLAVALPGGQGAGRGQGSTSRTAAHVARSWRGRRPSASGYRNTEHAQHMPIDSIPHPTDMSQAYPANYN